MKETRQQLLLKEERRLREAGALFMISLSWLSLRMVSDSSPISGTTPSPHSLKTHTRTKTWCWLIFTLVIMEALTRFVTKPWSVLSNRMAVALWRSIQFSASMDRWTITLISRVNPRSPLLSKRKLSSKEKLFLILPRKLHRLKSQNKLKWFRHKPSKKLSRLLLQKKTHTSRWSLRSKGRINFKRRCTTSVGTPITTTMQTMKWTFLLRRSTPLNWGGRQIHASCRNTIICTLRTAKMRRFH